MFASRLEVSKRSLTVMKRRRLLVGTVVWKLLLEKRWYCFPIPFRATELTILALNCYCLRRLYKMVIKGGGNEAKRCRRNNKHCGNKSKLCFHRKCCGREKLNTKNDWIGSHYSLIQHLFWNFIFRINKNKLYTKNMLFLVFFLSFSSHASRFSIPTFINNSRYCFNTHLLIKLYPHTL